MHLHAGRPLFHILLPLLPSVSQHLLFAVGAVLVYVVTTRARREQRAPTSAIAWVMGLALLPYLVLPMYLLFGQRKVRVHSRRTARTSGAAPSVHWAAELVQSFGLPAPSACHIRLHADGEQARDALWALIDGAEHRLDICTFIIGDDPLGRETVARLVARARAGVQVRLLLDGFGALMLPGRYFDALHQAGGRTAVFRPLLRVRSDGPRNLRNHRKFAIADDARLWSGGRNLAAEYFNGAEGVPPWKDLSFDLAGPVASAAAQQFEADWAAVRQARPRPIAPAAEVPGGALAQLLPSGPDQVEDTAQALLLDACFRARRRILAVTPYFIPNESLRDALRLAARRGIAIDIAIPQRSNHRLADFARSRAMRDLAAAGVNFHMLPAMAHAKAVVVDDTLAMCGSINLDLRSLLLNHEANVVFYGEAEIAWLAQWVGALLHTGRHFDARPPSLARDIGEGLLLTVAFQL